MTAVDVWHRKEGAPAPLGATWLRRARACNFALYSRHAQGVSLLLFGAARQDAPALEVPLDYLRNKTGRVWHCRLTEAQIGSARYYAYRVSGPFDPSRGLRFDPDKVLLDPYARGLYFPPGFDRGAACRPGSNMGRAPLGVLPLPRPAFDWSGDRAPRHGHDLVIYELHVRGFTRRANSGVPDEHRGRFSGVVDKIPYLKQLGVTAVELLPVYQFDQQPGGDYWGYMPLSFFAPHQRYAQSASAADQFDEFRGMVKALHQADIEVILDVVYNHTTEQGEGGPTYSCRGIDNSTYYLLTDDLRGYRDDTGTGNTLRTAHPAVRKLVLDSLRYWVQEAHVDGFRFDLAAVLSRSQDGSVSSLDPAIISEIASDPVLSGVRLIAEPWDISAYQLGRSFPGRTWQQWNGRFRDDLRSFVKSDPGKVGALMARLYGSDDLFPDALDDTYRPFQSVNFITCHDGFCLYDLVAYNEKHNLDNGNENRDGTDDNLSWNSGFEGDDGAPPGVLALRRRQVKNFCALLFIANGSPMFPAGDEFMNTQRGNNNPYNQDNETTWIDWRRARDDAGVLRFWQRMVAFRKAHPGLARSHFWREAVEWRGVEGMPDLGYSSRTLALHISGAGEGDADLYVMINAYWQELPFEVPAEPAAGPWRRVLDTARPSPEDFSEPGREPVLDSARYPVQPRSVVVLIR